MLSSFVEVSDRASLFYFAFGDVYVGEYENTFPKVKGGNAKWFIHKKECDIERD